MNKPWNVIFLALFLLVFGLLAITNIRIELGNVIEGLLAILAAICLVLEK